MIKFEMDQQRSILDVWPEMQDVMARPGARVGSYRQGRLRTRFSARCASSIADFSADAVELSPACKRDQNSHGQMRSESCMHAQQCDS